jgi:hypothetical protein
VVSDHGIKGGVSGLREHTKVAHPLDSVSHVEASGQQGLEDGGERPLKLAIALEPGPCPDQEPDVAIEALPAIHQIIEPTNRGLPPFSVVIKRPGRQPPGCCSPLHVG